MDHPLHSSLSVRFLWQNRQTRVRWLAVGGVLLAIVYLAPRASDRYVVVLLGLAFVLLVRRWPPLGLLALVFASLLVPFTLGTGTQTSLNVSVLLLPLLFGLWALGVLTRRDLNFAPSRLLLPLFVLCLVVMLSFVNGNHILMAFAQTAPLPAQLGGVAVFLLSATAFVLASHQLRDVRWLQGLTWLYLALGSLYLVGRLVPGLSFLGDRIFVSGATAGSLFWVWLVALAFGQAVYNKSLRWPWRLALAGLVVAALSVGFFQARSWTSGWLPPVVALMVALWVGKPRLGLVVTLVGGMAVLVNTDSVVNSIMAGNNSYSLLTRLEAWRILGEIIKISPILGLGPANYYWYTPLFPILGWHVSFNSHNNYVDIVAQAGMLGMVCFLWFVWELVRLGVRLRVTAQTAFGQSYLCGALGGLAGMLVAGMLADWVLPFVYNVGLSGFRASVLGWIFLGGLVALAQSASEQPVVGHETIGSLPSSLEGQHL